MTLARRTGAVFATITLVMGVVGSDVSRRAQRVGELSDRAVAEHEDLVDLATLRGVATDLLLARTAEPPEDVRIARLAHTLDAIVRRMGAHTDADAVEIEDEVAELVPTLERAAAAFLDQDREEDLRRTLAADLFPAVDDAMAATRREIREVSAQQHAEMLSLRVEVGIGMAVVFVLLLAGARVLIRSLQRSSSELVQAAIRVGAGERGVEVPEIGSDEFTAIARAFNRMSGDLARTDVALRGALDLAERGNLIKSRFIANMSHEFRTPLNAIVGYAELLHEELEHLPDAIRDLGQIRVSALHLANLVNDILDLAKAEAGHLDVELRPFPFEPLIDEVRALIAPLAQRHGNAIVVIGQDGIGQVHTDRIRLKQCLVNLLSNADKFTTGGTIEVRCSRQGELLVLEVEDPGIGIATENLGRLFQEFEQLDPSSTRRHGGTGLGLALTRTLCRRLGGDVVATSELGRGSTFRLSVRATAPVG